MITQYPWASVKQQQRKHIEIGTMVTLVLAILTFYSVPDFGTSAPVIEEYFAPPLDVVDIPATTQAPERVKPLKPALPIPMENAPEIDDPFPVDGEYEGVEIGELTPPYVPIPEVPIWMVQIKPEPIGGYVAILKNIVYPEIAREAGIEGRVVVEALIDVDGTVREINVLEGLPRTGLDDAAVQAIWLTRFTPAYQQDKPVPVRMAIPIVFSLK